MRWLLLVVGLSACTKAPPEQAVGQRSVHPDLHCPSGTIPAGKGPPNGYDAWCQKGRPNGTWVRHGPNITWHPNEQRASFGEFVEGKRSGHWEYYFPTGSIERQGSFVGGVAEGVWTAFHPSGARRSEGEMVDGKEHGTWTYWEEDGSWSTGQWNLGQRDGVWVDHDNADVAFRERTYRSGRMVGMRDL